MTDSHELSIFADQGLSDEQAMFCDMVADTIEVYRALAVVGWTRGKFRWMCAQQPAFATAVERAREIAEDEYVDKLDEVITTEPDLVRMRERASAIKWKASKRNRKYAERLDLSVSNAPDLIGALSDARSRVLRLRCDSDQPIDVEFEAVPSVAASQPPDDESSAPPKTPELPDIFS